MIIRDIIEALTALFVPRKIETSTLAQKETQVTDITYITPHEILMGRDVEYPLSPELHVNLGILLQNLNKLRAYYGKPMTVSSGYRPGKYNKAAGGAEKSAHLTCEACDFKDIDGSLDQWCLDNQDKLSLCGLWLEHPDSTPGWTHLDIRPRNNRVFRP